ncbi:MAG: glycosyltransferase family 4 protein, partial [Okeania sp. SIO3B3]|nr:glycosyltransferase family 4 protein [Okeania sp. SIO3B3]
AMYYGLPVICSNRAGARDVIKGNGMVIDPFDPEMLYASIKKFVENPEICDEFGIKSRINIEKYSVSRAAEALAGFIRDGGDS